MGRSHNTGGCVNLGEWKAVLPVGHYPAIQLQYSKVRATNPVLPWQISSIWYYIPGEGHGDILMVD